MILSEPLQTGVIVVGFVAFAVFLAGLVYALTNVLRSRRLEPMVKAFWVVVLVAVPIAGIVAWYVFDVSRQRSALPRAE